MMKTFRNSKIWPTMAAAMVCTAGSVFGQQDVTPRVLNKLPHSVQIGTGNGVALDAVLYDATAQAGFRAGPTTQTNPHDIKWLDDVPIPLSRIGGATTVDVKKVTVVVNRTAATPAMQVRVYYAKILDTETAPFIDASSLTQFAQFDLDVAAGGNETLEVGDGSSTLFTVDLNTEFFDPDPEPFGAFVLGLSWSVVGSPNPNGWRLSTGPDPNGNFFFQLDSATNPPTESVFTFGAGGPPARFVMLVEGDGVAGNPCEQMLPACPEDIAGGPGGTPDGTVGVPDLLRVISTWGQNGNPDGPRPAGDVRPLPNGDCLVGVPDLLGVISKWGACPVETRACCFPNGTCQNLSLANCTNQGGTWQGAGLLCADVTCPLAPANDNCLPGNPLLVDGSNTVNNQGATLSPQAAPPCASSFSRDVWYRYVASCTGTVTMSACASTGPWTDTVLAVYTGDCSNLTQVACNDDCTASNFRSTVSFQSTENTTYIVRIGSWGTAAGNTGDATLVISCELPPPPPTNDVCAGATEVTSLPYEDNDSLHGATEDDLICNAISVTRGRWYRVIGNGNLLTASTCDSDVFQFVDFKVAVYCGSGCASTLHPVACEQDNCQTILSTATWCSAPGQQYWVIVHSSAQVEEPSTFDYNLKITSGASCGNPLSCGLVCQDGPNYEGFNAFTSANPASTLTPITLPSGTWQAKNNSSPIGISGVFQGNPAAFEANCGSGYAGMNFQAGSGTADLSVWLMSPPRTMQNGQELKFYTRVPSGTIWPDRLEVRLSSGSGTDVGTSTTDVGTFTTLLKTINPTLTANDDPTGENGYPWSWTQFTVTISGLPAGPQTGRIAFRYFVPNGGPSGVNSNYIGIDDVELPGAAQ